MKIIYSLDKTGAEFPALYSNGNKKDIIIHIHGMGGSVVLNKFYNYFHEIFPVHGYSLLVPEHRGTAIITQHLQSGEILNSGTAYEKFEDCITDIENWIEWAKREGYDKIYLSGHILGCPKIVYFMNNSSLSKLVKGIFLISPPDMYGYKYFGSDKEFANRNLAYAINSDEDKNFLPELYEDTLLSCISYISLYNNENNNIFHYYDGKNLDILSQISCTIWVCTGTNDAAITTTTTCEKAMRMIKNSAINSEKVMTMIYENADHSFDGFGDKIAKDIIEFLN